MENFCWEWDVLKHLTAHVDTGAALPRALFDKMLAAKNFQSGLQTLRQVDRRYKTQHDQLGPGKHPGAELHVRAARAL